MKQILGLLVISSLLYCTPKGPVTYKSSFVGQSKAVLTSAKGMAKTIKIFDNSEAHIYKEREEYFGKKESQTNNFIGINLVKQNLNKKLRNLMFKH